MTADAPTRNAVLRRAAGWLIVALVGAALVWQESALLSALPGKPAEVGLHSRLALPLALACVTLLLREPWRWLLLALLATALAILLLADAAFLAYFQHPFRVRLVVALGQVGDASESALALLDPRDALPLAAALLGPLIGWRLGRGARRGQARTAELLASVLCGALAVPPLVAACTFVPPGQRLRARASSLSVVRTTGLLPYHLRDAGLAIFAPLADEPLSAADRRAILAAFAHKQDLNAIPSPFAGLARGRNVILVQLEAFQHVLLGLRVPGGEVTPNLNRLAQRGLAWRGCMDITRFGRTSDAEFAVLTGLPAHDESAVALSYAENHWTTLATELRARGYRTLSLHANEPGFWNRGVAHPMYGFDDLRFEQSFEPGPAWGWGLGDRDFFEQAGSMLAEVPEPFLALLISLSSHHPYRHVPRGLRSWPVGLPEGAAANYLRLVRYTDAALGRLLQRLRDAGLLERSLLVLYGDHGAGLDEASRDLLGALAGRDLDHPGEDRVPLVVLLPGQEPFLRQHRSDLEGILGGQQDLAPTVLHLLGLPVPAGFLGTHLFVPAGQRDPMPLPHAARFVFGDRVWDPLSLPAGPDRKRLEGYGRRAARESLLASLIIEHDAQGLAQELATLDDAGRAALAAAEPGVDDELPAWQLTLAGDVQPLPGGVRLVPFVPGEDSMLRVEVELVNTSDIDQPWTVTTLDAQGQAVDRQEGSLPPGAAQEVGPAAEPAGPQQRARYARVLAPPEVLVRARTRHALGAVPQPVLDRIGQRATLTGSLHGTHSALLLLINTRLQPVSPLLRIETAGGPDSVRLHLPPRGMATHLLTFGQDDGPVRIHVDEPGVALSAIRWNEAFTRFR